MQNFKRGFAFWFEGWRYILHRPTLLFTALVPLILSLLFMVPILWVLLNGIPQWSHNVVRNLVGETSDFWQNVIFYPVFLTSTVALLIGGLFLLYIFHSILAIPFYSRLAERVLRAEGKIPPHVTSTVAMLRVAALKSMILLPTGLVLFFCSFVPGLNFIALAGTLLIMSIDVMDYCFEAAGLGLSSRLKYMKSHKGQWIGMAAGLAVTMMIPALTLAVIPGAVVGAALIFEDEPWTT